MILVIDVGTSGLRTSLVDQSGTICHTIQRSNPPASPFPGMVEFDAAELSNLVITLSNEVLAHANDTEVTGIGISNQRSSTVVWDRETGVPVGPGLSWQDLRTVGECLTLKAELGVSVSPSELATKASWLIANHAADRDPGELCIGSIDSWLVWTLTEGTTHVTDRTNSATSGLWLPSCGWRDDLIDHLGLSPASLPTLVDSGSDIGVATALSRPLPIYAIVGDQQASLLGQGCIEPGMAKFTFGTGGMLDVCCGTAPPETEGRLANGTFPVVAWSLDGTAHYGVEGIMLAAGSNVEWLVEDLGLLDTPAASETLAMSVPTTDGVVYVPALLGFGTPHWDYGARGAIFGLTRGSNPAHITRAVLEGVAHRGADLAEAVVADSGMDISTIRVDGGMSQNTFFTQTLADVTGRTVEVSPIVDATTLGAGFLAGTAAGIWPTLAEAVSHWSPLRTATPQADVDRHVWRRAVERSAGWIPELSALDF